jgi:putative transposase
MFVPKFRKRSLSGKIRQYLRRVFYELARQKGSEIVSGHIVSDHVYIMRIDSAEEFSVSGWF